MIPNADPGPNDVATLRRLLVESEARNAELRMALLDIRQVVVHPGLRVADRLMDIHAIVDTALGAEKED